jgi:acetoin utilization deacetylase AcuC-like enzyme
VKTAFLHSDALGRFDYGSGHPLKPFRLQLTCELIRACGLLGPRDERLVEASPAGRADLAAFHAPDYLDVLAASNSGRPAPGAERYGLGPGDNPVFPGLYDWSALVAGASLRAADLVDGGEADVAFSISGGLHHAHASRASGFCYVNDAVLAIMRLAERGRRVAYIDIDAHHGDGVQEAFYDIVVSQLGVDSFRTDPLAHLNATSNGFCGMVRTIRDLSPKWVALGGGGYDLANVARAWTLAWAIMNDVEAPDEVPPDFLRRHDSTGFLSRKMRDEPFMIRGPQKEAMRGQMEAVVAFLRKNIPGLC